MLGNPSEKGKVMDEITRIGVDLAKRAVFQKECPRNTRSGGHHNCFSKSHYQESREAG